MDKFWPTFIVSFEVVVPTDTYEFEDGTTEKDLILFAVSNALDQINSEDTASVTWIDELENHHMLFVDVKYGVPQPSWRKEYWEGNDVG